MDSPIKSRTEWFLLPQSSNFCSFIDPSHRAIHLGKKKPDLLEVCSPKTQFSDGFIRSVSIGSPTKSFHYSQLPNLNTNVTLLQGSPYHIINSSEKHLAEAIDSPFRVSSEDSVGFLGDFDHKITAKIEEADLTAQFDETVIPPFKVPSKLPKDLLSLVSDCGIILV